MANNKIQVKRTSTSGRSPNTTNSGNTQYIDAGELALNMADGILYSSNGSAVISVGANNVDVNVSNTLTVKAVSANGSNGTSGQVLKSNGTATYWATDNADVGAANQILYRNSSNALTSSSGLVYDGTSIKVNGNLESVYQNGNEGGEIFLNAPAPANTSIAGTGVTIDIFQNRLRFFEQGGNNRGAYIDITAAANGVGSNLLTGGGGGGGTVTSVGSGDGLTGGPITGSGTLSVLANNGIIANATGLFVNQGFNFSWTGTQTFQANVAFTGNNITLSTNTGSVMFAGAGDTNWRIGRSTGSFTKRFYTNNTLDFIAANSNLEGIAFGYTGSEVYLETGYNGTYTKNPIYIGTINATSNGLVANATVINIGNSTVNSTINSTAFTGAANNASYLGGTAAASFVQNTDSRTLSGNLVISGTYFNPSSNAILLGNSTQRWIISGNSGDFSSTVNAVTSVNSALLTVGTAFIANTTGAYHTGTVNAASITTTGVTVNTIGVYPTSNTSGQGLGTATQRFDSFLDTVDVSGTINSNAGANAILLANQTTKWIYFTAGGAAAPTTTTRSDGTKIVIWPSLGASAVDYAIGADNNVLWYSVGQSTASHIWYANTTTVLTANLGGVYTSGTVNAASHTVGTTAVTNSTARYFGTINATSNGSVLNATTLTIGNSTVNSTVNSTAFTGAANNASYLGGTAAASFVQNTDSRTLSGNLVISGTYFNPSANTILLGNSTQRWVISGNSGDFSATVNAVTSVNSALLTVGTSFIANTTGAYHTGTMNAASHTVGSSFIANSTAIVGTGYANVTTSVNSALLTVGTSFIANTTGAYHTGTVNAASHTTTGVTINATAVALATSAGVYANSSLGTDGQVLTSNGTTVYWGTVSGGGGYYYGSNGTVGATNNLNNIFRVNANTLYANVTFNAGENGSAAGPIAINSGVFLTISTGARVAIV